jgi:hypothetical protein
MIDVHLVIRSKRAAAGSEATAATRIRCVKSGGSSGPGRGSPHRESEELVKALTPEQKARLLEHDYVSAKGIGVLWRLVDGVLRRARCTHETRFRTQRGGFYIDSDGSVRDTGG